MIKQNFLNNQKIQIETFISDFLNGYVDKKDPEYIEVATMLNDRLMSERKKPAL